MNKTHSPALAIAWRGYSTGDMSGPDPSSVPTPRPIRPVRIRRAGQLRFLYGLALLLSLAATTLAQENQELGRMWTFENPPLDVLEKEHGFRPDQEWLDALRLGSLRLGGEDIVSCFGSASFVSPNGLILSSNRTLRFAIAATQQAARSFAEGHPAKTLMSGFVAESLEQEIRLRSMTKYSEWLTAAQLVRMRNVTDEVNRGVVSTDTASAKKAKRDANKRKILDEARAADPKLVPQIVGLYQGAVLQLYQYKVYDDVRLVCTTSAEVARLGGVDEDSSFPRYRLDFAFLRAYEDGKPANTSKQLVSVETGRGAERGACVRFGQPERHEAVVYHGAAEARTRSQGCPFGSNGSRTVFGIGGISACCSARSSRLSRPC